MNNVNEVAKLHCLQTLLGEATGHDPYLTKQIKNAIDFSLTGSVEKSASLKRFTEAAVRLVREYRTMPVSCGICHLDVRKREFDPLWIHEELQRIFKTLSGYKSALLIVSGLKQSIQRPGKYWTRKCRAKHAEAMDYIDETAAQRSARNTRVNIMYF